MERSGVGSQTAAPATKSAGSEPMQVDIDTDRSRDAFRSRDRDER